MDLELKDNVALVTGASKGIGLAVTRTLLAEGAKVVAVSRGVGGLGALEGPGLVHVAADLTDPDTPQRLVEQAVDAFGGLDVLVNNAGGPPAGVTLPRSSFLDAGTDEWQAVFELNLFSVVRLVHSAVPALLARGGGAIINVSSANARQPSQINVDYGAAKSAMTNLAKALAQEFGPQGIRVNTVSPGPVRTDWWTRDGGAADVLAGATGASRDDVVDRLVPEMMQLTTGRLADPQEIADVVALLASPRSASTSGADFTVDSGFLKAV